MITRKKLFSREAPQPVQPVAPKMPITKDCVVTLDYTITDDQGNVLDSTDSRPLYSYLHGISKILPGLQKALEGKTEGELVSVRLLPNDAFGMHDPDRVQTIEPPLFDETTEFEEGMEFEINTESGWRLVTVKHVDENEITVDLNHPLAGKTIHVTATVVKVRAASEIERKHSEIY